MALVDGMFGNVVTVWLLSLLALIWTVGKVDAVQVPPVVFPPAQNWDGDDGPWSTFSLRVGHPEQVIRVLPSTSGYYTLAVLPGACNTTSDPTGCTNARGGDFDPDQSKTWQGAGVFGLGMEANLGYSPVTGDFGLDGIGFGVSLNTNLTFANQVVAGIVEDDFYLGYFGLGTQPTNFTTFTDSHESFFTSLWNNNGTPSYTWSYTAGAKYQLTGVLGTLIFGGYDSSKFISNNLTFPMSPDVSRDLVVGVQEVTMKNSSGSIISLLPSGGIFSFIDSDLPYIWLPVDACQAFEAALGLTWNDTLEMYLVDDSLHNLLVSENPSFTFSLGVAKSGGQIVDITLPYAAFDKTATAPLVQNTTSYFPLKRAVNDTQYTLGRAFLQEAYLIADYERMNFSVSQCTFQSGAQSNVVTIPSVADAKASASPTPVPSGSSGGGSSKGISGGAIAGIVIGVIAGIALVVALQGLEYLHSDCQLIHTDLKADNILMSFEDSSVVEEYVNAQDDHPMPRKKVGDRNIFLSHNNFGDLKSYLVLPKIADFGLAQQGDGKEPLRHPIQAPLYHAPELLLGVPWSYSTDIWNLGVLLFELLENKELFVCLKSQNGMYSPKAHVAEMIALLGFPPQKFIDQEKHWRDIPWKRSFPGQDGTWCSTASEYYGGPFFDSQGVKLDDRITCMSGDEKMLFLSFATEMLQWLPDERKTAKELRKHPWLRSGFSQDE